MKLLGYQQQKTYKSGYFQVSMGVKISRWGAGVGSAFSQYYLLYILFLNPTNCITSQFFSPKVSLPSCNHALNLISFSCGKGSILEREW